MRWLEGEHGVEAREPRSSPRLASPALYEGERTRFIDLTPEALRGKLAVAKAISSHARRLRFGAPHARDEGVPHPIV